MMHPKYERIRMLEAALEYGAHHFDQPIDRVEVVKDRVLVTAGGKTLTLTAGYGATVDERGIPMPGSGHWYVVPVEAGEAETGPGPAGFWNRLFGRRA